MDKYPFIRGEVPDAKQAILDMAGATVGTGEAEGSTTVFVTAEPDRLVVHYWGRGDDDQATTPTVDRWNAIERRHAQLLRIERRVESLPELPWNQRLAVTAVGNVLLVFFKRALDEDDPTGAGLYCDVFDWEPIGRRLTRRAGPPVPIWLGGPVGPGFSLWAGYHTAFERVILLVQVADLENGTMDLSTCRLRMADMSVYGGTVEPGDPGRWKIVDLEPGGFDLEATVTDEEIAILHRGSAASLYVTEATSTNREDFVGLGQDGRFEPLRLIRFDPSSVPSNLGT